MNRVKLESGKMISVESIWFIVFLFLLKAVKSKRKGSNGGQKTPQNLVKLSPPFFGEKSGTQLLASFCLCWGSLSGVNAVKEALWKSFKC